MSRWSAHIRVAGPADASGILAIYRPIVEQTAISFELEPPSPQEMAARIARTLRTHPWLVWSQEDQICGYAYATAFRSRIAYQWSSESSVYVHPRRRREGIGRGLYVALFEILARQGFHRVFAGIALPNPASVHLHEAHGFTPVGVFRQAGFKLGIWHDVGWWEKQLGRAGAVQPEAPVPFGQLGPVPGELRAQE